MTPTFHELWEQREQHAQDLLAAERALATYVADEDKHEIEDLRDPHGKRFLFDDSEGMAQQSTSAVEAILGASLVPNIANQTRWGRMRLRACIAPCSCLCGRCAWIRARARYERSGADPT
jgi:hypothetical protein